MILSKTYKIRTFHQAEVIFQIVTRVVKEPSNEKDIKYKI